MRSICHSTTNVFVCLDRDLNISTNNPTLIITSWTQQTISFCDEINHQIFTNTLISFTSILRLLLMLY